jgi:flagellar basal-body rod protein FlgB
MSVNDAPYFSMLKNRMHFLNERQKVLADNVANVSTPKYTPKDLDEKSFQKTLSRTFSTGGSSGPGGISPVSMVATSPMHIGGTKVSSAGVKSINSPDSETTLDGNSVVVEEQMIKVADTRMNYDIALSLYQKGLQLMRMASKKPGG